MYETHFQLRQRPFPATPDPARYYPATSHERAVARLLGGLADGEGVLALTGDPGTGKTLLCHCLLERLDSHTSVAFLTNSHVGSRAGLLQAILYDLSLPYEGRGEQELRLALTDHLLRRYEEGRGTILILDEAQHLTPDLLEELRLLGNLEARSAKAVQVVLVGQPTLMETLRRTELTALRQRLAVRVEVEPLPLQEAADYLLHHVRVAGGRPERLFADEALELLSRRTHGVPRLLNQAAHQALNLAAESGAAQVDVEAALEGLALLGLADEIDNAEPSPLSGAVFEEGEPMVDLDGTSGDESAAVEEENASHRLILGSGRAS
ncbi:MAG TPA: AAA family ATPase [Gemmataceae bacterium]|jgi:type II secretory pathway predicted ATPase ExeA